MSKKDTRSQVAAGGSTGEYFTVTDTFWGYVIGPEQRARQRAGLGEMLAVAASLAFGGIAFAQWLLPGSNSDPILVPFKIGVTAVFFVLSGMLYLMAKKGLTSETQIDLHEHEVRIVRRNRGNESVTLETYSFAQVRDVQVRRPKRRLMLADLCLDLKGAAAPVVLASAPEAELEATAARLRADALPTVVPEGPTLTSAAKSAARRSPLRTAVAGR